jgi:hypothetical protein
MHHYTKVSVIRETQEQDVSKSFFAEVVGLIRKEGATLIDPNAPETKKLIENFEQELTKLKSTSTNLEVGKPTILGIYDVRPNAESTLLTMAIKLQAGTESVNRLLVVGASIIHVKDRMLFVNSYRTYQSRTDLQTMKDSTTRWIDSIFAANEVRPTPPNPK